MCWGTLLWKYSVWIPLNRNRERLCLQSWGLNQRHMQRLLLYFYGSGLNYTEADVYLKGYFRTPLYLHIKPIIVYSRTATWLASVMTVMSHALHAWRRLENVILQINTCWQLCWLSWGLETYLISEPQALLSPGNHR